MSDSSFSEGGHILPTWYLCPDCEGAKLLHHKYADFEGWDCPACDFRSESEGDWETWIDRLLEVDGDE